MGGRGDGAARVREVGEGDAAGDDVELQADEDGGDLRGAGMRGEGEAEGACAGGEQASAGEQSRKRRRGGGAGTRKRVRVSGLGEVVVYVHTGVLRLQDVVVRGGASEDGGDSDTESHTRCESVAGFAVSSDGSLSVRGGSECTRGAACDGDEEGGRTEAIGRMAREELEAGLGRGRYAVGAEWDEGSMVHAIRRFGGRTIGWRYGNG